MNKELYGEQFENHLLEQYKLMVQMADKVSERRAKTNQLYLGLITLMITISSFIGEIFTSQQNASLLISLIGFLGIVICVLWALQVRTYRRLNTSKYKVIQTMEERLPYPAFQEEWKNLQQVGKDDKRYITFTKLESIVPYLLILPFIGLIILAFFNGLPGTN